MTNRSKAALTRRSSLGELLEAVVASRKEDLELSLEEALATLFAVLYEEGYNLGDPEIAKHTGLIIESVRSAMYASRRFHHPLQDVAESIFCEDDDVLS